MLLRAWQTGIVPERAGEYDDFASRRSRPMFERHDGLLGVLFLSPSPDRRVVLTVWRDAAAADALERSEDYLRTVAEIERTGFLRPPQSVERFEL